MKISTFKFLVLFSLVLVTQTASACINCNKEIRDAIFDSTFYPNLFVILSPFLLLALVVAIISVISVKRHRTKKLFFQDQKILSPVPLMAAATVLGIGLGGFIDGIVFHQVLQWHEMISNKIPPTNYVAKSVNMFWDGIFHGFTFLVTLTGVILLWKLLHRNDIKRSGSLITGGLLFGWGLFNLFEGIADHHILKLHNVREVSPDKEAWNLGFLAFSVLLLIAGLIISKQKKEEDGVYHLS